MTRDLVIGLGCRTRVSAATVRAAVDDALRRHRLDPAAVLAYATLDARTGEPGLRAIEQSGGPPLLGYPAAVLDGVAVPTPSARVAAAVGTASVAEAAAVCAATELAGPGAGVVLVCRKITGAGVTVAVARIGLPPADPSDYHDRRRGSGPGS